MDGAEVQSVFVMEEPFSILWGSCATDVGRGLELFDEPNPAKITPGRKSRKPTRVQIDVG